MLEKFKQFEIKGQNKNAIQGGTSSGQPGGSLNLRIRGQGSLSNNTPL
ncbi:MAG: hypothetical protein JXR05_02195 [Flavobacteriaceae bacterium]